MLFAHILLILALLPGPATADGPGPIRTRFDSVDDPHRPESLRAVAISAAGLVALAGEPETATGDFDVQIRDAGTGKFLRTLEGHARPVRSLAFSPDGRRLATVTADSHGLGLTRVFDVGAGRRTATIEVGGRLVRFMPDGRLLVAGFGRVLLFDAVTGREVRRAPAMPIVKDVSFDAGRALGVSHHGQSRVDVHDLRTEEIIARLTGCAAEPLAAVFSPDGRTAAAADPKTKSVFVWEVLTEQVVHRLRTETVVTSLAFTADGRHLLAGELDGSIRSWELATGGEGGRLEGHNGAVMVLAAGPDESLLSGATDRTAILWSLDAVRGTTLSRQQLAGDELDAAWKALAGTDATAAYRSLGLLAARPKQMLPNVALRLERQLVPIPDADLARRLAELDHNDYRVREAATADLFAAGDSMRPDLERLLAETNSPEVRSRLRILLRRAGRTPRYSPGELLRIRRLIGGLESVGSEQATRLLRLIAEEFPVPAVAAEASEALRRQKQQN